MRRSGFLYTVLAIFLLNLIILAVVVPLDADSGGGLQENRVNVDELFYFVESVRDDVARAVDIASRRAMVAVTNVVVNGGDPVQDAEGYVAEAFLNGTIDGNVSSLMEETSFRDWIGKMEQQALGEGYTITMGVELADVAVEMQDPFVVAFDFVYNFSIEDEDIGVVFDRDRETFNGTGTIDGVDDALLVLETAGKRFTSYNRCSSAEHASIEAAGAEFEYNYTEEGSERTWTSGDAVVFNGSDASTVDDRSEAVLITDAICEYDPAVLDDFRGVVSETETDETNVCGSGDEIEAYIGGISDHTAFRSGRRVVMNQEDVWLNRIPQRIESRCFFPDADAPSFLDRLEGDLEGDTNGVASFLDIPNLPPEVQEANRSAVDHVFFDDSPDYGSVFKIKGVTGEEEWFRLDEEHVDAWNLNDLTY